MQPLRAMLSLSIVATMAATFFAFSTGLTRAEETCAAVLQPANDSLQKAEAALQGNDQATAGATYDTAMAQLGTVPWSPADASCDANRYRFEKVLATARSLVIGIKLNRITSKDALALDANLLGQIYSLTGAKAPSSVSGTNVTTAADNTLTVTRGGPNTAAAPQYYHDHYPDLYEQYGKYYLAMADLGQQHRIALHNPSSANCANPNVDSEPLSKDMTGVMSLLMALHPKVSYGTYTATVDVQLTADGKVESAILKQSSGSRDYDEGVLQDARKTVYLPAVANCKQVPSVYVFTTTEKIQ